MGSSSCLSLGLGTAVILLLVLASALETGAIRPDAETRASVSGSGNGNGNKMAIDKPIGNNVVHVVKGSAGSISETNKSVHVVAADEVRAMAHKLPEFHEDYYGPSDHSPRHH